MSAAIQEVSATLDISDSTNITQHKSTVLIETPVKKITNAVNVTKKKASGYIGSVCLIAAVLSLVMCIGITRSISGSLKAVVSSLKRVASEGDLDIVFEQKFLARQDEIGSLVQATDLVVNDFRNVNFFFGKKLFIKGRTGIHILECFS